jgi:hypothetical protein
MDQYAHEINIFQHGYQKSRRTGLVPIIAEIQFGKRIQQTERIIYIFAFFGKMIAIVTLFRFIKRFLISFACLLG